MEVPIPDFWEFSSNSVSLRGTGPAQSSSLKLDQSEKLNSPRIYAASFEYCISPSSPCLSPIFKVAFQTHFLPAIKSFEHHSLDELVGTMLNHVFGSSRSPGQPFCCFASILKGNGLRICVLFFCPFKFATIGCDWIRRIFTIARWVHVWSSVIGWPIVTITNLATHLSQPHSSSLHKM